MAGIISFGAFIPRYRLNRMMMFASMGWFNPVTMAVAAGEKAVANYDEDTITMAVAASMDALADDQASAGIDGLYAASTTFPYQERLNANIIAAALDLNPNIRSMDFSAALKSGTSAILAALDSIESGQNKKIMVAASDSRLGKPGSMQEHFYGDGAGAVLIGNENVAVEFKSSFSISVDFVDHFRSAGRKFDRTWEERWIRDEGFTKVIPEAIKGLLKKTGLNLSDFSKVIYPCHFSREHSGIAKKLGLDRSQMQSMMMDEVGDTGSAHPLLMLAAALEKAKPKDKILLVSYGGGADALYFEVTEEILNRKPKKGVSGYLARREDMNSYQKYVVFRDIIPVELGLRGEVQAPTAFSVLWRERRMVLGLVGSKCRKCGSPQFPPQRICANPACGSVDQMDPYRFAGKKGTIFTYTGDMLAFSYDPPQIYGMAEMEGGGKLFLDFTDCNLEQLKVGQPVEISFRRKYYDDARGIHGYFWKAIPTS